MDMKQIVLMPAILHRTLMGKTGGDRTRNSIAVSQGQLFIRTNKMLFCVGD
jgi:hypothetical protein